MAKDGYFPGFPKEFDALVRRDDRINTYLTALWDRAERDSRYRAKLAELRDILRASKLHEEKRLSEGWSKFENEAVNFYNNQRGYGDYLDIKQNDSVLTRVSFENGGMMRKPSRRPALTPELLETEALQAQQKATEFGNIIRAMQSSGEETMPVDRLYSLRVPTQTLGFAGIFEVTSNGAFKGGLPRVLTLEHAMALRTYLAQEAQTLRDAVTNRRWGVCQEWARSLQAHLADKPFKHFAIETMGVSTSRLINADHQIVVVYERFEVLRDAFGLVIDQWKKQTFFCSMAHIWDHYGQLTSGANTTPGATKAGGSWRGAS